MGTEGRGPELADALALVDAEEFEAGASKLRELVRNLEGRELREALIGLGHASLWTERTEEALACAERSLELADQEGDREMRGPALALLSQVYGQRGETGDLARALEVGDRALEEWVPGAQAHDLAVHESLHALTHYWTGRYASAADLGRRGDDGATEALALVGLGRPEEAIERSDAAIASGREAGSALLTAYALCCSTAALRDVLDLDEARRRNEEAIELFRGIGFESGVMQGEMDLLYADLAEGEVARADRSWPQLWARLGDATGWERWLAPGRLSVAHAEISLLQERWEAAEEAAREAIDVARSIGREKYEVDARIVLGSARRELGDIPDATDGLRPSQPRTGSAIHRLAGVRTRRSHVPSMQLETTRPPRRPCGRLPRSSMVSLRCCAPSTPSPCSHRHRSRRSGAPEPHRRPAHDGISVRAGGRMGRVGPISGSPPTTVPLADDEDSTPSVGSVSGALNGWRLA